MERRGSECVLNGKIHIELPIYPVPPLPFLSLRHPHLPPPRAYATPRLHGYRSVLRRRVPELQAEAVAPGGGGEGDQRPLSPVSQRVSSPRLVFHARGVSTGRAIATTLRSLERRVTTRRCEICNAVETHVRNMQRTG